MNRKAPYRITAIIENGTDDIAYNTPSMTKGKLLWVPKETEILSSINGRDKLYFVGILNSGGYFRARSWREEGKEMSYSYYIAKLKPRTIILEDGRVFYDVSRESYGGGRSLNDLLQFLYIEFATKPFILHFDNLCERFGKN